MTRRKMTSSLLILVIKGLLIGWFLTQMRSMFIMLMNIRIRRILDILELFICLKCNTFWVTLILTQDFYMATIASFIGYLIDKHLINTPTPL